MPIELIYEDSLRVLIPDEHLWIDSARFSIEGADRASSRDVLARLLADNHYVNGYQYADRVTDEHSNDGYKTNNAIYLDILAQRGQAPYDDDMRTGYPELWARENATGPEHGPYAMSHISLETFDVLNGVEARQVLRRWVDETDGEIGGQRDLADSTLELILRQLEASSVVYRLHDLGEDAHHASGFVVDVPYLELVVVDLANQQLRLIAAGGD